MGLEGTVLSEISQTEKDNITYMWNFKNQSKGLGGGVGVGDVI